MLLKPTNLFHYQFSFLQILPFYRVNIKTIQKKYSCSFNFKKISYMKSSNQKPQLSIKDFQIIKQLGFGSFGKVQLVKKKQNKHQYAMKSILLSRVSQKQKDAALNQIRLLASINVPNVIQYEGSFYNADQQTLCIIMQLADGGDLQHKITERQNLIKYGQGGGMDEKFIWKVAYQILSGLKTLHQHNIVHRDIKSANIFFVKGIAKLGDLNISKVTENGFCSTQTGTPYYTSPQIWKGQTYNSKCDIWSLGCIIYEMATLRPPFKANDFPSLYRNILSGQYPQITSTYSEDLRLFIKMCLTVNSSRRPSAAQLLQTRILSGMELCLQNFDRSQGQVNLIDPIQCPKVLRFLNSKLPQPQKPHRSEKKKTVIFFGSRDDDSQDEKQDSHSTKFKMRKIRSEKIINFNSQKDSLENLKSTSKKNIKLPPIQNEAMNQMLKDSSQVNSMKKIQLSKTSNTVKEPSFKIKKNQSAKSLKCIGIQNGKQNSKQILM